MGEGSNAHLEKLFDSKLYRLDKGFLGHVVPMLSKVDDLEYDSDFKQLPAGEDLIELSEGIVMNLSTG